ncbi:hypothetical protein BDK51DRAFT_44971 [Blyttiomyces helicus]|uniref:Uncharacterized protein n=1 Tax=Blyttiomyces helicus TaxID=388810 RepID=A0A4P9WIC8_9FUNG|nr:hypothetical protein BDK51DRAFT_44971 [Blyttiomyces helicus]|eukprot:RKO91755.1 hypothetical protein BDK51DRAFT_44971 [Blyttiomyces helicus]
MAFRTATGEWTLLVPTSPVSYNPNVQVGSPRRLTCFNQTLYAALPDGSFSAFDLATLAWSSLPTPPAPVNCVAPVVLGSSFFDPATKVWTPGQPYPHDVNRAGSAMIGDTAYVFSGFGGDSFYGDLNKLDTPTSSLTLVTNGTDPSPRQDMCFAAWNGQLILYGGNANLLKTAGPVSPDLFTLCVIARPPRGSPSVPMFSPPHNRQITLSTSDALSLVPCFTSSTWISVPGIDPTVPVVRATGGRTWRTAVIAVGMLIILLWALRRRAGKRSTRLLFSWKPVSLNLASLPSDPIASAAPVTRDTILEPATLEPVGSPAIDHNAGWELTKASSC